MSDNALEVRNLNASIGKFSLQDISFTLPRGAVMGLVGLNGAGKTTLIKSIIDFIPVSKGEVLFFGKTMEGNEAEIKSKIGVVFDQLLYGESMVPYRLKKYLKPFYPDFFDNRFNELMHRFGLDGKKSIRQYSKGMKMKLGVVLALSYGPDLIILDEPTAGLDAAARAELLDVLGEVMQDESKSVLISTHITSDLEKIADYITMIDGGRIVFCEAKDELLDRHALVQIEKDQMNDEIAKLLFKMKATSFGFEGLSENKSELSGIKNIKFARPTIEDIIVYRSGTYAE